MRAVYNKGKTEYVFPEKDVLEFEQLRNGEVRVYIEDTCGHHVSACLHADELIFKMLPIFESRFGGLQGLLKEVS